MGIAYSLAYNTNSAMAVLAISLTTAARLRQSGPSTLSRF
jgi:hypothetical protein